MDLQQVYPGMGGDAVLSDAVVAQVQRPQVDCFVQDPGLHHLYLVVREVELLAGRETKTYETTC